MIKKEISATLLLQQKLLPLYYHDSAEVSVSVLSALYEGGIKMVEYTNRGDAALENFKVLRKSVDEKFKGLELGTGTIKTASDAELFINAGADFIICPSMNTDVAKICQVNGLLWIPGCMTATEIADAENAGAEIVKIFPGNLLGPSYIVALQGIFPKIKFIVTGGVEGEEQNIKAWFEAGAAGLGMGSTLITKKIMAGEDYNALTDNTSKILQLVNRIWLNSYKHK